MPPLNSEPAHSRETGISVLAFLAGAVTALAALASLILGVAGLVDVKLDLRDWVDPVLALLGFGAAASFGLAAASLMRRAVRGRLLRPEIVAAEIAAGVLGVYGWMVIFGTYLAN
jgi:hypothetical protein